MNSIYKMLTVMHIKDDMYISIGDEGMKWLAKAVAPASYIVDYFI